MASVVEWDWLLPSGPQDRKQWMCTEFKVCFVLKVSQFLVLRRNLWELSFVKAFFCGLSFFLCEGNWSRIRLKVKDNHKVIVWFLCVRRLGFSNLNLGPQDGPRRGTIFVAFYEMWKFIKHHKNKTTNQRLDVLAFIILNMFLVPWTIKVVDIHSYWVVLNCKYCKCLISARAKYFLFKKKRYYTLVKEMHFQ